MCNVREALDNVELVDNLTALILGVLLCAATKLDAELASSAVRSGRDSIFALVCLDVQLLLQWTQWLRRAFIERARLDFLR